MNGRKPTKAQLDHAKTLAGGISSYMRGWHATGIRLNNQKKGNEQ